MSSFFYIPNLLNNEAVPLETIQIFLYSCNQLNLFPDFYQVGYTFFDDVKICPTKEYLDGLIELDLNNFLDNHSKYSKVETYKDLVKFSNYLITWTFQSGDQVICFYFTSYTSDATQTIADFLKDIFF